MSSEASLQRKCSTGGRKASLEEGKGRHRHQLLYRRLRTDTAGAPMGGRREEGRRGGREEGGRREGGTRRDKEGQGRRRQEKAKGKEVSGFLGWHGLRCMQVMLAWHVRSCRMAGVVGGEGLTRGASAPESCGSVCNV